MSWNRGSQKKILSGERVTSLTVQTQSQHVGVTTHRGVIRGDINQDFCGASAAHISVAVPHTADQVGLSTGSKQILQVLTQWAFEDYSSAYVIIRVSYRRRRQMCNRVITPFWTTWSSLFSLCTRSKLNRHLLLHLDDARMKGRSLTWQKERSFIVCMCVGLCVISLLSRCPCQHEEQSSRKPSRVQANHFTICWADPLLRASQVEGQLSIDSLELEVWPRSSLRYYSSHYFSVPVKYFLRKKETFTVQMYTFFPGLCI